MNGKKAKLLRKLYSTEEKPKVEKKIKRMYNSLNVNEKPALNILLK